MTTIEYRKVQCDQCKKEVTIKGPGSLPMNWLEINISEWHGTTGTGVFDKEVCSRECGVKLLNKLKKIPKNRYRI